MTVIITIVIEREVTAPQTMSEPALHTGFSVALVGGVALSVCEVTETEEEYK